MGKLCQNKEVIDKCCHVRQGGAGGEGLWLVNTYVVIHSMSSSSIHEHNNYQFQIGTDLNEVIDCGQPIKYTEVVWLTTSGS